MKLHGFMCHNEIMSWNHMGLSFCLSFIIRHINPSLVLDQPRETRIYASIIIHTPFVIMS